MTTHPEDGFTYRPAVGKQAAPDPSTSAAADPDPPPPAARRPSRWKRVGVVLAALALVPVVATVWWFLRETTAAAKGAASPEAATIAWMYDVRAGEGDGPGPFVDQAAAGDVARVRARVLATLRAHSGSTLELGSPPDGQATPDAPGTVTEWWRMRYPSDGGSALGPAGAARAWRFTLTQNGDEWWITRVEPPDMCEYFRDNCQ